MGELSLRSAKTKHRQVTGSSVPTSPGTKVYHETQRRQPIPEGNACPCCLGAKPGVDREPRELSTKGQAGGGAAPVVDKLGGLGRGPGRAAWHPH